MICIVKYFIKKKDRNAELKKFEICFGQNYRSIYNIKHEMPVQIHNEGGVGKIEVKGMSEDDHRAMLSGTYNRRPEKIALLKKWVKKDLEIKKKLTHTQFVGNRDGESDYWMENQPEMTARMNKLLSQRKMSSPRKPGFGVGEFGSVWGDFTMLDGTTIRVALYFIELQKQNLRYNNK